MKDAFKTSREIWTMQNQNKQFLYSNFFLTIDEFSFVAGQLSDKRAILSNAQKWEVKQSSKDLQAFEPNEIFFKRN